MYQQKCNMENVSVKVKHEFSFDTNVTKIIQGNLCYTFTEYNFKFHFYWYIPGVIFLFPVAQIYMSVLYKNGVGIDITHTHTHTHFGWCVCVCVFVLLHASKNRWYQHLYSTYIFVCCAKWIEIILSMARKNILLHKMGQVTNLNNRVKCARGIKAPSWRCLCVCVYACVIHTLIRALRTRVRQLFFCCCCCSHWWNIIVRTS